MKQSLDYHGPQKAEEIPLTRCPKCGGLKRGACKVCAADRRDKIGGVALNWIGLIAAAVIVLTLLAFSPPLAGYFAIFAVVVLAVRFAKR